MTAPLPPASPSPGLKAAPLLLWVLVQLIALALSAAGTPLWAHHPLPRTSLAVETMLVAQLVGIWLLFPVVLSDVLLSLVAVAFLWPFLQLAGLLASAPQSKLVVTALYVSIWTAGLGVLNHQLRTWRFQFIAVALTAGTCLGGLILLYLHAEVSAGGGIQQRVNDKPSAWWLALTPFVVAALIRGARGPNSPVQVRSTLLPD